jgi:hypothetical protein
VSIVVMVTTIHVFACGPLADHWNGSGSAYRPGLTSRLPACWKAWVASQPVLTACSHMIEHVSTSDVPGSLIANARPAPLPTCTCVPEAGAVIVTAGATLPTVVDAVDGERERRLRLVGAGHAGDERRWVGDRAHRPGRRSGSRSGR